jgi:hypothetical protein
MWALGTNESGGGGAEYACGLWMNACVGWAFIKEKKKRM